MIVADNGSNLFLYYASNTLPGSIWININGTAPDITPA